MNQGHNSNVHKLSIRRCRALIIKDSQNKNVQKILKLLNAGRTQKETPYGRRLSILHGLDLFN